MPTSTRAAVAEEGTPGFTVQEVTLRDPGSREVVVEIAATALCYTDWHAVTGDMGIAQFPIVLGHSAVGTIVDIGRESTARVGDRVVITATPECGVCFWCRSGRVDQCEQLFAPTPVIGRMPDGRPVYAPGGSATYAERAVVRDIQVWPTSSVVPDEWLAMFGCGMLSGMGAVVNVAKVEPGASVVVVGCGQLGLWMIQAARLAGANSIIAVDPLASRRDVASRIGADHVIDPAEGDALVAIRELTDGRGADFGFDAGGTLESVRHAFLATRNAGVVTVTSYVRRDSEVALPLYDLALRGRDVRSSQSGRLDVRRDLDRFVPWLESGAIDVDAMIGGIYALDDIDAALRACRDRTEITPIVVPGARG